VTPEELDKVIRELNTRMFHLRSSAAGWRIQADKLEQQAKEAIAESRGIEDALDRLKPKESER
jgi:ribosomal protein L29